MHMIVLDPGHGGTRDNGRSTATGVRGPRGTLEKDVTLRLARGVAQHLGGGATLTREERDNPSLDARAETARQEDAAVFVSLHANEGAPGARGSEVWVHDRCAPESIALSYAIEKELARLGGPHRGTWRGNLSVLAPDRLAPRTAACLVEADYLSDPEVERRFGSPNGVDGVARAIARGIDRYLRQSNSYGGVRTAAALEEDYFTDADQLDATLKNPRAADTRSVSTRVDAHAVVDEFRSSAATSPWRSLTRATVADRLDELIDDSRLIYQGNLNLCGPASFICVWAKRDPLAFARFATTLFDTGTARIGTFVVAPTDSLVHNDYAAMGSTVPQGDWMVLGALRNNDDAIFVWSGESGEELAGITFPEEIERWLRATGLYASVDNQVGSTISALTSKGFNAAAKLEVREGTDIIVLIQANMVASQIGAGVTEGFLSHFSNHWVVLLGSVMEIVTDHSVAFPIWTFGKDYENVTVATVPLFAANYYGAIVARLA
jgi:N-acetylmuramoyl-L-alanine amidase-like protein